MSKKYVNNGTSCQMKFETECLQCESCNYNTFGVECTHTKDEHLLTHAFTLMEPRRYFDFEGRFPHWHNSFDTKCCHVEVHCINEIVDSKPAITRYRIICTHPIGEDHVTHVFNVVDLKDYDWKKCECDSDESSDSSSSHSDWVDA